MSIVTTSAFETGKFKTAFTQFTVTDLQACIDRNENKIMTELLGVDLYAEYLAQIALSNPDYEKLRDAFIEEINGRSEEHASELQSHHDLVCRLLLEKTN